MSYTFTLGAINDLKPCKEGREAFLAALGLTVKTAKASMQVTIGDIAAILGFEDALWVAAKMIANKRERIALMMKSIKRTHYSSFDGVPLYVNQLEQWVNGDESISISDISSTAWNPYETKFHLKKPDLLEYVSRASHQDALKSYYEDLEKWQALTAERWCLWKAEDKMCAALAVVHAIEDRIIDSAYESVQAAENSFRLGLYYLDTQARQVIYTCDEDYRTQAMDKARLEEEKLIQQDIIDIAGRLVTK